MIVVPLPSNPPPFPTAIAGAPTAKAWGGGEAETTADSAEAGPAVAGGVGTKGSVGSPAVVGVWCELSCEGGQGDAGGGCAGGCADDSGCNDAVGGSGGAGTSDARCGSGATKP